MPNTNPLRPKTTVDFPQKPNLENYLELLNIKAQNVLKDNLYRGKTDTGYTAASGQTLSPGETKPRFLYPFQWLWDTFFIAAWSSDINQSLKDINKFLASQRADGFLGHIRYNRDILARKEYFPPPNIYYPEGLPRSGEVISKITQPPNIAFGVWELAQKIPSSKKRLAFLKQTFPQIMKYHHYLYQNLVQDGLMVTIHPWQAGDDNSPKWDQIYRSIKPKHRKIASWLKTLGLTYERVDTKIIHHSERPINPDYDIYLHLIWLYNQWHWDEKTILQKSPFRVCDPLTNSVLLRSNLCLLKIAKKLKAKDSYDTIKQWLRQTQKGLNQLWSKKDGLYYAKDLHHRRYLKVGTVSSLLPLFSRKIPAYKAALLAAKIRQLAVENPLIYLIPSTFPDQNRVFEPIRYWRGPVWIIINTLIADGLSFYGYRDLSKKIALDSLKLVYQSTNDRGGFFEYFDPLTGSGLGSPLQSWTAAAVLSLTNSLSPPG